jgi:hypothetical protein
MLLFTYSYTPNLEAKAEPREIIFTGSVQRLEVPKPVLASAKPQIEMPIIGKKYEKPVAKPKYPVKEKARAKAQEKFKPKEPARGYTPFTVEAKIRAKFGVNADRAVAIARCESSLNPSAIGDLNINPHSYGVFQIRGLKGRPAPEKLLDADLNIDYAFQMSGGGKNWKAWSCSRKV